MEVKYYSFKVGFYTHTQSEWILHDLKIPAYNVKEAVITFFWHLEFGQKITNQWILRKKTFEVPSQVAVHQYIRQAIEYRIARKSGFFLVQYKKIRVITGHEIITYFK